MSDHQNIGAASGGDTADAHPAVPTATVGAGATGANATGATAAGASVPNDKRIGRSCPTSSVGPIR
jgi:hypothetical protein